MEWFIAGVVVGAGASALVVWLRSRRLKATWYEWLMAAVAIVLALMALQLFFASRAELEPGAAWLALATMGVPALALAAIAAGLSWRRSRITPS